MRTTLLGFFLVGACALALAGYGYFIAVPQWPATRLGMLCGIGAALCACLPGWRLMPAWWRQQCAEAAASAPHKRYARAMWPAMGLYVLLIFGTSGWVNHADLPVPAWLRGAIALLPALPIALVLRAMIRYLREIDELQRRIETEAICIAALAVPMAYFAAGLLQAAEVIAIASAPAMLWVFPLMMLTYGAAKFPVARHYR